jgi:anti-sigma regulatory factor (Ser/Thr protein kinase)
LASPAERGHPDGGIVAPVTEPRSLRLPAAAVADLAAIRGFVREAAAGLDARGAAIPDLVCAVDEVAANVFRHGYGGRPGPIEVQVERTGDDLLVRLLDEAPPFDPTGRPSPDLARPLAERSPGGLGIHLALASVDRAAHRRREPQGNVLELVTSIEHRGRSER